MTGKLEIKRERGSLYFDSETGYLRLNFNGIGPGIELTEDERLKLSRALWYSAKPIDCRLTP